MLRRSVGEPTSPRSNQVHGVGVHHPSRGTLWGELVHCSVYEWVCRVVGNRDLDGVKVVDLGSLDVNGNLRGVFDGAQYVGVDMRAGPNVDVVCKAEEFADQLGEWDIVVSTEMLEHCERWQDAVLQMQKLVREGGEVILTCRGPGFQLHGYPNDFWRFTPSDLMNAFSSFEILDVCTDIPSMPGACIHARKPIGWVAQPIIHTVEAAPNA